MDSNSEIQMNEHEEDAKLFDLSKSVNAACAKWLLGRGIRTGSWRQLMDDNIERIRARAEAKAAKAVDIPCVTIRTLICDECGKSFDVRMALQKFCSNACRQKRHRDARKAKEARP